MPRLRSLVRRGNFDFVHVHSPYAAIGARVAIGRNRHGSCTPSTTCGVGITGRPTGATPSRTLGTTTCSPSRTASGGPSYPSPLRVLPMPTVETLYQGLDRAAIAALGASDGVRDEFGIPDDAPLVGMVANFKPHKGHAELMRAVVKVRRAIPEVRFMLVGVGPLEAEVRADAERLGVEDAVIFTGFRDDVPRILGALDPFTLASTYEGLSIALIEAMALGRAVVVTRAGGHAEVVSDRQDGLLVPTEDVPALADGLIAVLEDGELRDRLGIAARRRAEDFDIRRTVRRTEEVYEELLR